MALNVKTALRLAEMRGVVLLAAAQAQIPAHSYSPRSESKASATRSGEHQAAGAWSASSVLVFQVFQNLHRYQSGTGWPSRSVTRLRGSRPSATRRSNLSEATSQRRSLSPAKQPLGRVPLARIKSAQLVIAPPPSPSCLALHLKSELILYRAFGAKVCVRRSAVSFVGAAALLCAAWSLRR